MSSDATQDLPSTPLVAGKYQLLGLIGRGGMGSVWEGRHTSLGTRVAIKFIDAEFAKSEDARSRFDNEARAAATIQSKHAIQVFDHGTTPDGRLYIVMELLEGEPLDKRLTCVQTLPLAETARIIRQVGRALQRAHDHGIIHRDLKPENIFLVRGPDDDEDVAKVLDFGIAKMKSAPGAVGVSSATKTGTLLGTPFFMSPEQARGLRTVDHRSDLWALGVIVFKCVTGVLPFDGESLGDLLVKICTAPIPVPSQAAAGLPAELDAWMVRALERDPDRRFQTAGELSDALATLAGISVRRDPTTNASSPNLSSGPLPSGGFGTPAQPIPAPPAPTQMMADAQPILAASSAPFTASAPRSSRSSSRLGLFGFGAVALGLLAGGGVLVFKYGLASSDTFEHAAAPARSPHAARPPPNPAPAPPPPPPAAPPPLASAEATASAAPSATPPHLTKPTKLLPWKPPPKNGRDQTQLPTTPASPKPASNVGEPGY